MFTAEQWLSGNTPSLLSSYKAMTSLVTINQTLTKCKSSTRLAMLWPLFEFFTVRDHISGFPSMQFFTLKGLIFYALYTVSLVILYCWGAPEGRTPVVFLGRLSWALGIFPCSDKPGTVFSKAMELTT